MEVIVESFPASRVTRLSEAGRGLFWQQNFPYDPFFVVWGGWGEFLEAGAEFLVNDDGGVGDSWFLGGFRDFGEFWDFWDFLDFWEFWEFLSKFGIFRILSNLGFLSDLWILRKFTIWKNFVIVLKISVDNGMRFLKFYPILPFGCKESFVYFAKLIDLAYTESSSSKIYGIVTSFTTSRSSLKDPILLFKG